MESRTEIGSLAEAWVADRLLEDGWRILARNHRTPYGEIDLLVRPPHEDEACLVAVEVKSRHDGAYARGEEVLRPAQRARLGRALQWCALRLAWSGQLRVDLAEVELVGERPQRLALHPDVEIPADLDGVLG